MWAARGHQWSVLLTTAAVGEKWTAPDPRGEPPAT